jgi:ribosomal protein L37E
MSLRAYIRRCSIMNYSATTNINRCPICGYYADNIVSIDYLDSLFNHPMFYSKKIKVCSGCGVGFLDTYFKQ